MHPSASLAPITSAGRPPAACGRSGGPGAVASGGLATTGASEFQRLPGGRRAAAARRTPLRVEAFAQGYTGSYSGPNGTYERVLRYPTGEVRRIRYPLPPAEEAAVEDLTDGCWADTCWEPRECWLPMAGSGGKGKAKNKGLSASSSSSAAATAVTGDAAGAPPTAFLPQQPPAEPGKGPGSGSGRGATPSSSPPSSPTSLPSSPMELLRYLNSPEYKASQEELWRKVRGSYEVLDGCPWVAPKPLYLLAVQQQPAPGSSDPPPGLGYSLRTRVARADTGEELSRVLGRRAADGGPLISCSEMKDGVVAFEDEADAERFGQLVEADSASVTEVSIARCDSHELFRSVQDVRGVVVLLRRGGAFLPQPHQLATSLRAKAGAGEQPLLD